eukprot:TRINITY_DN2753_c0_g1_i2.p1 TRINITY_DN2753_c0_g1~~TRINITY_DN2753_c0_g1_i2.p1  ORF type:complete len:293 (+),score=77.94 TRINITY_DN2753_c0_g1_i2:24-902(+)
MASKTPSSSHVGARTRVKSHVLQSLKNLDQLKEVISKLESAELQGQEREKALVQAKQLKESLNSDVKALDQPILRLCKVRILKSERNKNRLKRKREDDEKEAQQERRRELLSRMNDEWFASKLRDQAKEKQEAAAKKREAKEKAEVRKQKAKDVGFASILIKLEKLRNIRRKQMLGEQRSLGGDESEVLSLHDLVKREHERLAKDRKEKEALKTEQQTNKEIYQDENRRLQEVLNFYYQASSNKDKLLLIRRSWDSYVVPPNTGGTRIPQHYPEEAAITAKSELWKSFVVQR